VIAGKVWGTTETLLATPLVEVHRIVVLPGGRCSRHRHATRSNAFYVVRGWIEVHVEKKSYGLVDVTRLDAGQITVVPPGETHWFVKPLRSGIGYDDRVAEVLEVYFPAPLGPDDIQRDDHGEREEQPFDYAGYAHGIASKYVTSIKRGDVARDVYGEFVNEDALNRENEEQK
jgi:mannose-6-phosphate isomerase-like protein (cupin superfamily)